jgi:putative GTP pyrophosphokinase
MTREGLPDDWWRRQGALREQYDRQRDALQALAAELVCGLEALLARHGLAGAVRGRVKGFDTLYRKVLGRSRSVLIADPFDVITDVIGLRIVTPFIEDLQRIESAIREDFALEEVDDKALALSVGEFGYDATHLLIAIPASLRSQHGQVAVRVAEVQLRTTLQDAWAEVEHELVYKADLDVVDQGVRRKLLALNATLSLADTIFQEIRDYQRRRYAELRSRHQKLMDTVATIPERGPRRVAAPPPPMPMLAPPAARSVAEEGDDAVVSDLLVRALAAHLDADLGEAIALYSQVLAVRPIAAVFNHRGIAYFTVADYDKAVTDFTEAIAMAPDDARGYTNRGLAHRMAGRLHDALADLDHSMQLNPTWADTLYGRALTQFDLGNIGAALRDCDCAIAIKPDFKQVIRLKQFLHDPDL